MSAADRRHLWCRAQGKETLAGLVYAMQTLWRGGREWTCLRRSPGEMIDQINCWRCEFASGGLGCCGLAGWWQCTGHCECRVCLCGRVGVAAAQVSPHLSRAPGQHTHIIPTVWSLGGCERNVCDRRILCFGAATSPSIGEEGRWRQEVAGQVWSGLAWPGLVWSRPPGVGCWPAVRPAATP